MTRDNETMPDELFVSEYNRAGETWYVALTWDSEIVQSTRYVRAALQQPDHSKADIEGAATRYVWSLDGDGMSTSRGVRTREALIVAFIEGAKHAATIKDMGGA